MSGIAVVFNRSSRAKPVGPLLDGVAAALADLGRDGSTTLDLVRVGFVYTHQGDLTPEDVHERQPVRVREGRLTIVFDGRIDNRADVRRLLSIAEQEMSQLSDSELFAQLWERWDERAADLVIGPFAAIVWDAEAAEVVAVRDPLGRRVLTWHATPDRLIVATAPRGIHACGVLREVDELKLVDALILNNGDVTRTFYSGISMLRAGHLLRATASSVVETEYRDVTQVEPLRLTSDDDYLDAAREVTAAAVGAILRTTHPPSFALSGGLDSSHVVSVAEPMLRDRGDPVHAYTSVPLERWRPALGWNLVGDETAAVNAFLAMHPDIVHTYVRAPDRVMTDYLDSVIAAADAPPRNVMNLFWIHEIHRLTRERGARVVITGEAGNATLGWNGDSIANDLLAQRRWGDLVDEIRASSGRGGAAGEVYRRFLGPALPRSAWERVQRLRGVHFDWRDYSALDPSSAAAGLAEARAIKFGFDPAFRGARGHRWSQLRMIDHLRSAGNIIGAMGVIHGTEARDPLVDRRVVEFALAIPTDQFRRNGRGRWLQRRLLAGHAPSEVIGPNAPRGRQAADSRLRVATIRRQLRTDLDGFEQDPTLAELIDLRRLRAMLDRDDWWTCDQDPEPDSWDLLALSRAIAAGRFVEAVRAPQAVAPVATLQARSAVERAELVELRRTRDVHHERRLDTDK